MPWQRLQHSKRPGEGMGDMSAGEHTGVDAPAAKKPPVEPTEDGVDGWGVLAGKHHSRRFGWKKRMEGVGEQRSQQENDEESVHLPARGVQVKCGYAERSYKVDEGVGKLQQRRQPRARRLNRRLESPVVKQRPVPLDPGSFEFIGVLCRCKPAHLPVGDHDERYRQPVAQHCPGRPSGRPFGPGERRQPHKHNQVHAPGVNGHPPIHRQKQTQDRDVGEIRDQQPFRKA